LKTVNIPVPPLAEQHRIVAKVDELMALCDALERQAEDSLKAHQTLVETCLATLTNSQSPEDLTQNWTRIEAHFDTLFTTEESVAAFEASIYELAIKGVLVDQQPNDEPTATFLKSIGIQPEEAGAGLPATWSKCSLGELGKITGGGTPKKTDQRFWGGEIPWVSPKDMKVDYISDSTDKITEAAVAGSAVKLIESGSLLFVVRGMILAHSFPVAITETQVTINQDMKAIDLSSFDQAYVLLMMKGLKREVLSRVDRSSHGTCKLVSGKLWSVGLPIPPRAEQSRIAAKVQVLVEICADLRERLQSAAKKQTELADILSVPRRKRKTATTWRSL
jgi:type I restriction enzyme S subunit